MLIKSIGYEFFRTAALAAAPIAIDRAIHHLFKKTLDPKTTTLCAMAAAGYSIAVLNLSNGIKAVMIVAYLAFKAMSPSNPSTQSLEQLLHRQALGTFRDTLILWYALTVGDPVEIVMSGQAAILDQFHQWLETHKTVLSRVTFLDLTNKTLTTLPPEIGYLSNLLELHLSKNDLKSLPVQIGQLASLRRLEVNQNKLSFLPSQLSQLTNLSDLDVSINKLAFLPSQISQLTNLIRLDVSKNELKALPTEMTKLTHLIALAIQENPFGPFAPEVEQFIRQIGAWA